MTVLPRFVLALLTLTLAAFPALAQGAVHVVAQDGGPGAQFTEIQPAVNAAQDGDVILVRDGFYAGVVIRGRSLTIVRDGLFVNIAGLSVLDTPPGASVSLSGLWMLAPVGVLLEDNRGSVIMNECRLWGLAEVPWSAMSAPGVRAVSSDHVVLVDCDLGSGGQGHLSHGLEAIDSDVSLSGCTTTGGGSIFAFGQPNAPGAGILVRGGTLLASDTTIEGGFGQDLQDGCSGGEGGPGLVLQAGATGDPIVTLIGCTVTGGVGGLAYDGCDPGGIGPGAIVTAGTIDELPITPRGLTLPRSLREGVTAPLLVEGEPGDVVLLGLSAGLAALPVPGFSGILHLDLDAVAWIPLGTLDAAGTLQFPVSVTLPASLGALPIRVQAIHGNVQGDVLLGPPAEVVAIDAAF